MRADETTNWAGNVAFGASNYHAPTSVAQLQQLVARSDRVRAQGTGHSFNRVADTTGELVSLAALPRLVDIDTAAAQVRVSAGLRYGELAPRLDAAGFALRNLASLPHISVAGACATGTHGSGNENGNLATEVAAIEVVATSGELVELSRDTDPDRFAGVVIALGSLGVVSQLTLDLVPSYDIAQYVYEDLADDVLGGHIHEILGGGYSVSVFTDLSTTRIWRKCRASDPVPAGDWFGARPAVVAHHPLPGVSGDVATEQLGRPGPWHQRLPHFRLEFTPSKGEELQAEYLLDRRDAAVALAALRGIRDQIAPVLQIAEIRTVAADELWLSPSYRRDTVGFHFTFVRDEVAVAPVLAAIEQVFAPFEPRPHWGKLFGLSPDVVREQYQRMADFGRLLREYDPVGKFGNELTDRYLR
jgi:alditol oxidase